MSMRLQAALRGDLRKMLREELEDAARGITRGVEEVATRTKGAWRSQVTRAGLGNSVAKSVRHAFYFNQGLNAAGLVYSKAPKILRAFEEGGVIRSKRGKYLAIPTANARRFFGSRAGRGRGIRGADARMGLSPSNFPGGFSRLQFIPLKRGGGLLVLKEEFARAKADANKRFNTLLRRRGDEARVMFVLVPQVTLRKRLDIDSIARQADRLLIPTILRHYRRAGETD